MNKTHFPIPLKSGLQVLNHAEICGKNPPVRADLNSCIDRSEEVKQFITVSEK